MKRFLRYFVYRELYRWIRKGMDSAGDKPEERREPETYGGGDGRIYLEVGEIEDARLKQIVALMQAMDPFDFEEFVADLWRRKGWSAEVSSGGSDRGVDVVATKEYPYRQKALIQVKRYTGDNRVGSPEIQQYASLRQQRSGVDKAIVVTSGAFTGQARELARQLNVKLVDGFRLAQMVHALEAYDLFERYLDVELIEEEVGGRESASYASGASDGAKDGDDVPEEAAEDEAVAGSGETESQEPVGASENQTTQDATEQERDGAAYQEALETGNEDGGAEPVSTADAAAESGAIWYYCIWLAVAGWVLVWYGVESFGDGVWGTLFFGSWILLPAAIYLDATRNLDEDDWPRYPWLYAVASVAWLMNFPVAGYYLWRRRTVVRRRD